MPSVATRIAAGLSVLFAVPSAAHASAVAYPASTFARPSEEKALVVWDEANKTEHLLRALSLKGDAETFGVLLATPTLPTVSKEGDGAIDRTGKLFALQVAPDQPMLERTQLGDVESVTIKASDDRALGEWLAKNQFSDKPALRNWAKSYVAKGWYLTAVRATSKGVGDRKLEVPVVRLSFKTDAPVFPYSEAPPDDTDEAAYRNKYNPRQPYRGYTYGTRPFDVYLVAPHQMQMVSGQVTAGPTVADSLVVLPDAVSSALGDTKAWGFDPKSRPKWVVTHLSENVWQRTTQGDLGFAKYDLPKPRAGTGITDVDDRPTGPTFPASSMEWMADPDPRAEHHDPASHHKTLRRIGAIALFLLLAAAVGFALMQDRGEGERS